MTHLVGPWVQTYSGKKWDLLMPHIEDVDWYDVAHSLAHINRYTGHAKVAYSVGQHSCHVHDIVRDKGGSADQKLAALLHDAPESVTGDMSTPMKQAMQIICPDAREAFRFITDRAEHVLFTAAGLSYPVTSNTKLLVKDADVLALVTEKSRHMNPSPEPWGEPFDSTVPLKTKLRPWKPEKTINEFLSRLWTLTAYRGDEVSDRVAKALVGYGLFFAK